MTNGFPSQRARPVTGDFPAQKISFPFDDAIIAHRKQSYSHIAQSFVVWIVLHFHPVVFQGSSGVQPGFVYTSDVIHLHGVDCVRLLHPGRLWSSKGRSSDKSKPGWLIRIECDIIGNSFCFLKLYQYIAAISCRINRFDHMQLTYQAFQCVGRVCMCR